MIKSIIHRLKRKGNTLLAAELVEQRALERVMSLAQERTRDYLCQDCLDRRCLSGKACKIFNLIVKSFAWEITAEKAELN